MNVIPVGPRELARVAAAAYEGKGIRVSLGNDPSGTVGLDSTTTAVDALKLSGGGYSDFTATLGTGAYDAGDGRHEVGVGTGANLYVVASFGPFSAQRTYNIVYVVIDGHTYISGMLRETPAIVVPAGGSPASYPFQIVIDDAV